VIAISMTDYPAFEELNAISIRTDRFFFRYRIAELSLSPGTFTDYRRNRNMLRD